MSMHVTLYAKQPKQPKQNDWTTKMKWPEQIDYNLQNKMTNMTKTKPVQPLRRVEDYRGSSALTNIV